jgi:hypothetical protein
MIVPSWIFLRMTKFQTKDVEKNKTHCVFNNRIFYRKPYTLWDNVENYHTARHDNVILRMLSARLINKAKNTLRKRNTYCFSTAKMVTRTHLSVVLSLYANYLFCSHALCTASLNSCNYTRCVSATRNSRSWNFCAFYKCLDYELQGSVLISWHTHARTHHTHRHARTHTQTDRQTRTHAHRRTHAQTHTSTHTDRHTHARTHTTDRHTHAHMCTHAHTDTHTRARKYTQNKRWPEIWRCSLRFLAEISAARFAISSGFALPFEKHSVMP